ncbi:M16 family metallopeptidase [Roseateles saccharophilus]|uniref:Zinc protease n=1 Tax=Roseateles saccharophilus TaxID=304 RepID=A0A4R3UGI5_ROSSA|nr:pitrilysin family protein [Roseateles saccharophilus]MDG0834213.1 insulinase family protein [Roseateles saccharophilus]TCU89925.1 zinc protease [Roseateles saccharophilus]
MNAAPASSRLVHLSALLALAGTLSLPAWSAPAAVPAVSTAAGQLAVRQEKLTLANGFEVILVEDHRLPLVAFNLWVHAGPRNEAPGQTGFAHLFEHLMFAGSRHVPRGEFDRRVDAAGGTDSNGSTNFDRTNYFFTLPSNQLALGLWLKSDMLGWMIDEVDSVSLANQQDVVRNERRQSFENRPYGIVEEAMYQALYPEGHPYRAAVIGSHADIQGIKLADVKAFARTYYRPNNATLVLAGDFDAKQARALVQKYFGSLKPGPKLPEVKVAMPEITKERRLVVTDRIELSRLDLAWHTPAMFAAGDAELDMAAHVLGGGKASRLYGLLVRDKQLAQSVEVGQSSQSLSSVFDIEVVARPGASLDEIETLVDAEVARLAATPPTEAEMAQARATIQTQLLQRMEKVASLADLVNSYNQMAGDPGYAGRDLARYAQATPASVSATVAKWLQKAHRVVVLAQPGEQVLPPEVPTPPMPTKAGKGERESLNALEAWRSKAPGAGKAKPLTLPAAQSFTLANGLTVIHSPKAGLPLVSASLVLRAGQGANPAGQPGLASFVAAMLPEGTTTRSAQQIAEATAALGATLTTQAGSEEARLDFSGLKASAKDGLALLADLALHPAFATPEIERQKAQRLAALAQAREQAPLLANAVANRVSYGEGHPLALNALGSEASIQAVDAAVLRGFWQARYRPENAALVVAGDLSEAELRALIEPLFGAWKGEGAAPVATPLPPARPIAARTVLVDKPGAPQTALAVVAPGPFAGVADAADIKVMNAALGGLFTSRINTQLREVKGYTYGIYSGYTMGRERGQFGIRGSVRTDVTGAALADMWKEIEGMRARPMGAAELGRVRNAQLLSLPGLFDTNGAVVAGYAGNWSAGQPLSAITELPKQYGAVTAASALRAAQRHLDPASLIVVAVGDRAKVLPQLEAIGRKAEVLNAEGKP